MLINNLIFIENIHNEDLDFYNTLSTNNTVIIKNCTNLTITIGTKINKIIINKSKLIKIDMNTTISSIEINKSNKIFIKISKFVPCIELYKSSIYLLGNNYNDTILLSEYSNVSMLY